MEEVEEIKKNNDDDDGTEIQNKNLIQLFIFWLLIVNKMKQRAFLFCEIYLKLY